MGLMTSNRRWSTPRQRAWRRRLVELAHWADGNNWRDRQEELESELRLALIVGDERGAQLVRNSIAVHQLNRPRG